MTEKNSKVKFKGSFGPIEVSSDFPLEGVLKKFGIPYQIITEKEFTDWYMKYQKENPVECVCPMPMPAKLFFEFENYMFGTKNEE